MRSPISNERPLPMAALSDALHSTMIWTTPILAGIHILCIVRLVVHTIKVECPAKSIPVTFRSVCTPENVWLALSHLMSTLYSFIAAVDCYLFFS
ncbi:hypothetical protein BC830DRAFT_1106480 [Chytriomyces sp. MP71]|nr:hypothetical protein BC830DRAFT_1106480 [Chytriomyces sp. MP71]